MSKSGKTLGALGVAVFMMFFGQFAFTETANARSSTKSFTCDGLRSLIASRGAVVMNTKNRLVYDRLVHSRRYCASYEITENKSVPTKTGQCRMRVCVDYDPDDDFFRRRFRTRN